MPTGRTQADNGAEDPRVRRSRATILPVATEHFVRHGYVGANVDLVALEAGVSKRTVYNVFGGKQALFHAVLDEAIGTADRFSRELAETTDVGDDLAADLRGIGLRLARTVLIGPVVRLRRLLIGEVQRFPELAREYYDRAPGQVMDALAVRFTELARRGRLRIDDAAIAAEHFAFLVMGASLDRALFLADPALDEPAVEARAAMGVQAFLRAYGDRAVE